MNILLLGAGGFIGTNLAIKIAQEKKNVITAVDSSENYLANIKNFGFENVHAVVSSLDGNTDFNKLLYGQDIVYHLVSTNVPTTSNQCVAQDIQSNVIFSSNLFEACVKNGVKKVVFMSSGGTVYGKEANCPISENMVTQPISSYGLQKVTIEKLLYLYKYMYGLDYRIIRLANPYGPYQRPNGILGAVTTFTYKALKNEEVTVFGDGSVIRDYIYIEDAVRAIINIVEGKNECCIFNIGCGYGTSINQLLATIQQALDCDLNVVYKTGRSVDVPVNYLNISRYEECFGRLNPIGLYDGILKTAEFLKKTW